MLPAPARNLLFLHDGSCQPDASHRGCATTLEEKTEAGVNSEHAAGNIHV